MSTCSEMLDFTLLVSSADFVFHGKCRLSNSFSVPFNIANMQRTSAMFPYSKGPYILIIGKCSAVQT